MFNKERKPINVENLSEVPNDNEIHIKIGEQFFEMSDSLIQIQKQPVYGEDEWDNIHGDIIHFR